MDSEETSSAIPLQTAVYEVDPLPSSSPNAHNVQRTTVTPWCFPKELWTQCLADIHGRPHSESLRLDVVASINVGEVEQLSALPSTTLCGPPFVCWCWIAAGSWIWKAHIAMPRSNTLAYWDVLGMNRKKLIRNFTFSGTTKHSQSRDKHVQHLTHPPPRWFSWIAQFLESFWVDEDASSSSPHLGPSAAPSLTRNLFLDV